MIQARTWCRVLSVNVQTAPEHVALQILQAAHPLALVCWSVPPQASPEIDPRIIEHRSADLQQLAVIVASATATRDVAVWGSKAPDGCPLLKPVSGWKTVESEQWHSDVTC